MGKFINKIREHYIFTFIGIVVARFKQTRSADMASSLTFTTLLSMVPLITIAITLFAVFPQFSDFTEHSRKMIVENILPETGGKLISRYMEQFAENVSKLKAVGIGFLAFTAMLMIFTIDNAFNTIWRVTKQRNMMQRILVYWAVLTLAPPLMGGSLSMTSWLINLPASSHSNFSEPVMWLIKAVPLILATLAFALLFRIVPNRFVPIKHAFIGGAVSAIAFETMSRAFAMYIASFPTYKVVYGAFASIPIFLLWIYLSWLTVLLGAVLTASLSHWRSKDGKQVLTPDVKLYYSLCILRLMNESLRSGVAQTLPSLSKTLKLGFDTVEELLEKMGTINLVERLRGYSWIMTRSPEHVKAIELYRLYVFDPSKPPHQENCEEITAWLGRLADRGEKTADVSLRELFT